MKKRILTGDRPTGKLHLGHYIGSLRNRVQLQDEYEAFILIADVQALTDNFEDPQKVHDNIRELALDYLATGIDPKKSTIVIQSMVPEIAELTVFYMNLVNMGRLKRNPTVKEEMKQKGFGENVPLGFLAYPVSQAADITAFQAHLVPVGEDQLPMLEQTREIVRRFNGLYGKTLIEPKPLLSDFPRLVGIDGKEKMSKSLNNVICLAESNEKVKKKVMKMYTDPNRIHGNEPGKVKGNPVFIYHDAFNPNKKEVEDLKFRYKKGTVKDVEVKEKLVIALNNMLDPIRKKRKEYENNPRLVNKILLDGVEKARKITSKTLADVKKAMKIDYF